ncbi:MAG: aldo/keto reductase [Acidobacteria bacterium]|nr:aldo/keto reductase [Acidobacteriota bacterium]
MDAKTLGRSGLLVSPMGLGCWAIGGAMASGDQQLGYAGVDDDEARAAIRRGVELGVTLFDTADAYGAGHSERLLGQVLGGSPDVLVATKFGNTIDESTRQLTGVDVTPAYVRTAVQASSRRLQRSTIDLYQVHTPDMSQTQADDLAACLEDLADAGAIRWWGVSTDDPEAAGRFAPAPHLTALQIQLNVLDDNAAMLELCDRHDLAALCRSPLAMGLLGGRYDATSTLPADDIRGKQPEWLRWFTDGRPDPGFLERLDRIRAVLTSDGRTLAQGALAWIWARHARTVPLPGFRDVQQVEDDTAAARSGALTPEAFASIEMLLGRTEAL